MDKKDILIENLLKNSQFLTQQNELLHKRFEDISAQLFTVLERVNDIREKMPTITDPDIAQIALIVDSEIKNIYDSIEGFYVDKSGLEGSGKFN